MVALVLDWNGRVDDGRAVGNVQRFAISLNKGRIDKIDKLSNQFNNIKQQWDGVMMRIEFTQHFFAVQFI